VSVVDVGGADAGDVLIAVAVEVAKAVAPDACWGSAPSRTWKSDVCAWPTRAVTAIIMTIGDARIAVSIPSR
jgi:hypothetical protein